MDDGCGGVCVCAAGTICNGGYCFDAPPIQVCEVLHADSAVHQHFFIEGLGELMGRVQWQGTPSQLITYFKHMSPHNHAWSQGGSPLESTVEVTQEESEVGDAWDFYVANTSSSSTEVCYTIEFEPK